MSQFLLRILPFFVLLAFQDCSPEPENGFRVSGTDLIDANGNPFIIRGVNNPHIWYLSGPYESFERLAELNVNCVRIVWETRGKVDSLERAVLGCIQNEMIPMVELHDATGDTTSEKLMDMVAYFTRNDVKEMLLKYENYLLLNIANEWGNHNVTGEFWRDTYMQAIDSLRAAGYSYTLVIDAPGWGQNLQPILDFGNELLEYDEKNNLLFSVHMYGSWNDAGKIETELKKAHTKDLPLIVGEFGYDSQGGNNNLGCRVDHMQILKTCDELNYGFIPWSWTGNNQANAWLDMAEFDDWNTLTDWGKAVFEGEFGITATAKKATVFENSSR